jgi:hypothetical protein
VAVKALPDLRVLPFSLAKDGHMPRELKIDQELKDLCRPLDDEERTNLKDGIAALGCLDAIKVWKEKGILYDGHNRYEICHELGKEFEIKEISFPDRQSVINEMIRLQIGRRNVTKELVMYLRGKQYHEEKKEHGNIARTEAEEGRSENGTPASAQNEHLQKTRQKSSKKKKAKRDDFSKTADKIASQHNVSSATIRRDAAFATLVDGLPKDLRDLVKQGRIKKGQIKKLASLSAAEQAKTAERVKDGGKVFLSVNGAPSANGVNHAPKVLCARCARVGAIKNCEACKEAKKKATKAKPATQGDANEEALPTDAEGTPVPEQAREAFALVPTFGEICRAIDAIVTKVQELGAGPAGRLMHTESYLQGLRAVRKQLWISKPTHVCPYCKGSKDKCECCKGQGWTDKGTFEAAPK